MKNVYVLYITDALINYCSLLTLGQSRVTLLTTGQCGPGGQLVVLVLVHVLSPYLDVGWVNPRPNWLGRVEHEADPTHLGEPAVKFGPL